MPRRVFPEPADVTIAEAYAAPLDSRTDRPWVGLCMVSSVDGSTVVDGRSSELSSENDVAVLHGLRKLADVIIVGAGTVRGEGYGPPQTEGQRVGVVTRSGSVDLTLPLFASGAGFIITTEQTELDGAGDGGGAGAGAGAGDGDGNVDVVRAGSDDVDLRRAIDLLGTVHPAPRFVQVEGGALLNGSLLEVDAFDEINLTTSPLCVGGSGPRVMAGAQDHAHRYEVAQIVVDDESFVFTRWRRRR